MAPFDISVLNKEEKLKLLSDLYESLDPKEFIISDAVKSVLDARLRRLKDGDMSFFSRDDLQSRIKSLR